MYMYIHVIIVHSFIFSKIQNLMKLKTTCTCMYNYCHSPPNLKSYETLKTNTEYNYTHKYTYICTYKYICTCIHMYMYMCVHVYVYTHTVHVHTYIHVITGTTKGHIYTVHTCNIHTCKLTSKFRKRTLMVTVKTIQRK